MMVNLDGCVAESWPESLHNAQRAVYYGDTLFESIRVFDSEIRLMDQHWSRLSKGLVMLGYTLPNHWNADYFRKEILKISPPNARVRLSVWRSPGGLYLPEHHLPQFLITAQPLDQPAFAWTDPGVRLGVCTSVQLPVDTFSNLKTLNCPRYVAAANEAYRSGWDDGLLLNSFGRICEATSSNVFWWKKNQCYTVPLAEGCVAGVMRHTLMQMEPASGYSVLEKPITFAGLQTAEEIFLTNAIRGIIPVRIFADRNLNNHNTRCLFERVFKGL